MNETEQKREPIEESLWTQTTEERLKTVLQLPLWGRGLQ